MTAITQNLKRLTAHTDRRSGHVTTGTASCPHPLVTSTFPAFTCRLPRPLRPVLSQHL